MEDYFDALEAELGPIIMTEQLCPGVCYLAVKYENEGLIREYYAVTDTPVISQAAKAYGHRTAGLWLFPMEADTGGWRVVRYEINKYLQKNGLPLEQPLLDLALFAAEFTPEYFGAYPVPYHTPNGRTTRHWVLANGIYWVETDQCEEILTACYPIWSAELSGWVERMGRHLPVDEAGGVHQSRGYIFFPAQLSSIPLYELMQTRPEWEGSVIDKPALMNAIWAELPEYAVLMNRQEQMRRDELAALLWSDAEWGSQASPGRMICISPYAGKDYCLFKRQQ